MIHAHDTANCIDQVRQSFNEKALALSLMKTKTNTAPDNTGETKGQTLVERLRAIASSQSHLDVAQFQFINLEEVKNAYGDKWPQHRVKIRQTANHYLAKRVKKNDVIIPGNDGFVVVFGDDSGPEAEFAAVDLAHGLNEFLLGELHDPLGPTASVSTNTVHVEALVETFGDLVVTEEHVAEPPPALDPVWRYQPVWDVKKEALPHYYAFAQDRQSGARLPGYQFERNALSFAEYRQLDLETLAQSEAGIRQLFETSGKAMVGVSLHVQTLANSTARAEVMKRMDSFDSNLLRYRLLQVSAVPPGFPRIYLQEIVGLLKRKIPNIVVSLAIEEQDLDSIVDCGVAAVGFSLPTHVTGVHPKISRADLLDRIRLSAKAARARRVPFFIEGPLKNDLVMRLSGTGIDYVSSPLIWQPTQTPQEVTRWTADKLISG